jgi:rare lipoprotein A
MRRAVRWLLPALALALLAGCGGHRAARPARGGGYAGHGTGTSGRAAGYDDITRSQGSRYRDGSDSVPAGPPPDLSKIPEPVPREEPRALYGNKSPYSVLGRTYNVLPTAHGYVERGIASFYGNKFHGYKTSTLEDYDMYQFTAAHKTLPLPSYARVTNLENGKSVVVRINDRGPFRDDRLIDLSYVAAVKIGIWPKGTGLVEVRALDPGEPLRDLPPPPPPPPPGTRPPGIYLQVGAFADTANAERVAAQLRQANFAPVQIVDVQVNGRNVHRVRVGPLADVDTADQVTDRIEGMGLPRPQVAVD